MKTLTQILSEYNTDKETYHHYGRYYEEWLSPYRDTASCILEIGIFEGTSLQAWSEYFDNALIIGVDIDLQHCKLATSHNRIHIIRGDVNNPNDLRRIGGYGSFDIIIDDGSHQFSEQLTALLYLWPYLKPHGRYIIEDLQSEEIANIFSLIKGATLQTSGTGFDDRIIMIEKMI